MMCGHISQCLSRFCDLYVFGFSLIHVYKCFHEKWISNVLINFRNLRLKLWKWFISSVKILEKYVFCFQQDIYGTYKIYVFMTRDEKRTKSMFLATCIRHEINYWNSLTNFSNICLCFSISYTKCITFQDFENGKDLQFWINCLCK